MYSSYSEQTKECILLATDFLLKHNFFVFDQKCFLQICGAAKGGKFSPSLANICMSAWEPANVLSESNPCASHIRWYGCYIDDLLLIWEGSHRDAGAFVSYINKNTCQLRFTHTFDVQVTNFLDLTLTGDKNRRIMVTPYRKPSTNSTLMADSCHPPHVVKNVPVGELIWL